MDKPWLKSYDPEVPWHIDYPDFPIFQFLDQSTRLYPQNPCITYLDFQITYREMSDIVTCLASGLLSIGLIKGDRVALMLGNVPQFVAAFYGILKAGGIVSAVNPSYKERELRYQVNNSGCRFLIASTSSREIVEKLLPGTSIETVIFTEPDDYRHLANHENCQYTEQLRIVISPGEQIKNYSFLGLFRLGDKSLKPSELKGQDPAIFQYSGGTTGTPKAVIGLHRNLVANTLQFRHWLFDLQPGQETVLTAIPLYHVYGMVIAMCMGIALAANLVLIPNPRDIEDILSNIEKYKATIFPGVPNMYLAINRYASGHEKRFDLHSIKACISGSAPLLKEIKNQFESLTGGKLLEGYGLSEAPTATHCNPYQGENRTGSIGLPLPDVDCRIVDLEESSKDVEPGKAGELLICSPQVMQGYHNMPGETAQALQGGWLHTGDIARMDEQGYFYLVDRKKDVIKAAGFQVWPREVEDVLCEHPAIMESAVAGVIHPQFGEIVRAWIILKPDVNLTKEDVKRWCKERLVGYKVPVEVEFIDQLPKTNVGKVLRRELVRIYQENNLKDY